MLASPIAAAVFDEVYRGLEEDQQLVFQRLLEQEDPNFGLVCRFGQIR